jgi:hypothetical protein
MPPAAALKVIAAVLAATVEAAVKETCCGVPGVSVKFAGAAATPFGNPLRVTAIGTVKPLTAAAENVAGAGLPPGTKVRAAGARLSEKSEAGEGEYAGLGLPFPQPSKNKATEIAATERIRSKSVSLWGAVQESTEH